MLKVLATSWALLLGVLLLMVGNGMQGSLLGIRGTTEGFSTYEISYVMSAYFVGFLFGSRLAPDMIRNVGHVRVFAALGSLISAVLVVFPVVPDWVAWAVMRALLGFCFSGVYVTAESWLNNTATNETRGQAMSLYMIVQMIGIITSQALLNIPDPSGYVLFILPSVLVSLAFTPILLAPTPAPVFETIRPLPFRRLFRISPLGCAGMLLSGSVFSTMFGMAAVWGAMIQLSVQQITIFIAAMYVGGLIFQYPIGWASDRMDRRKLILGISVVGAVTMLFAFAVALPFPLLVGVAVILGGVVNPLYSLLIAYTNDYLTKEDMAAASAGMIFLNGLGAIGGPMISGWLMAQVGAEGFFLMIGLLFAALSAYAAWRMTRRASAPSGSGFAPVVPSASVMAVEAVRDRAGEARPT
ncbi:MAG: MFS transporter [Cereibacter sphaeroides]|uniref:MFS transporter n=1 Tax=Cereibacter sphaeroides TaxID=1063 RepID=A0A2W5S8R4_CERSP|nr:MAG: MFS transporter [Cereibacter sphaeroides]